MRIKLILTTLFVMMAACTPSKQRRKPPENVEIFLKPYIFGDNRLCLSNSECTSGMCYFDMCVGVLFSQNRWMIETISAKLEADAKKFGIKKEKVSEAIIKLINSDDIFSDLKIGRLFLLLASFDKTSAKKVAEKLFYCKKVKNEGCSTYLKFVAALFLLENEGVKRRDAAEFVLNLYRKKKEGLKPYLKSVQNILKNVKK